MRPDWLKVSHFALNREADQIDDELKRYSRFWPLVVGIFLVVIGAGSWWAVILGLAWRLPLWSIGLYLTATLYSSALIIERYVAWHWRFRVVLSSEAKAELDEIIIARNSLALAIGQAIDSSPEWRDLIREYRILSAQLAECWRQANHDTGFVKPY